MPGGNGCGFDARWWEEGSRLPIFNLSYFRLLTPMSENNCAQEGSISINRKSASVGARNEMKPLPVELDKTTNHKRGESVTYAAMQQIPLTSAYLCQDCNCIGNSAKQCPACASVALLSLSGVLNREPESNLELSILGMPGIAA